MPAIARLLVFACLLASTALARGPRPPLPRPDLPPKAPTALQKLPTHHFDIQFTIPAAAAKPFANLCERAYRRLSELLDVPESEAVWDGKCGVLLLATREQFMAVASATAGPGAAVSGGFARPSKREPLIVLPMYGQERVRLEQVLIHEMTHIFLQLFRKEGDLPTWVQEGSAQHFEFLHHPADSRLKQWQALVKALVASNRVRPLREFWTASFSATDAAAYAQAWSLVNYLTQCPRTKGKVGKFVLKLKDLSPERRGPLHVPSEAEAARLARATADRSFERQAAAFHEVFGITVDEFERAWKQFVLATY